MAAYLVNNPINVMCTLCIGGRKMMAHSAMTAAGTIRPYTRSMPSWISSANGPPARSIDNKQSCSCGWTLRSGRTQRNALDLGVRELDVGIVEVEHAVEGLDEGLDLDGRCGRQSLHNLSLLEGQFRSECRECVC